MCVSGLNEFIQICLQVLIAIVGIECMTFSLISEHNRDTEKTQSQNMGSSGLYERSSYVQQANIVACNLAWYAPHG